MAAVDGMLPLKGKLLEKNFFVFVRTVIRRPVSTRISIDEHLHYLSHGRAQIRKLGRAKDTNLQDFDHFFLGRSGCHFFVENLEEVFTVVEMR
jgi:hypothetical protein